MKDGGGDLERNHQKPLSENIVCYKGRSAQNAFLKNNFFCKTIIF